MKYKIVPAFQAQVDYLGISLVIPFSSVPTDSEVWQVVRDQVDDIIMNEDMEYSVKVNCKFMTDYEEDHHPYMFSQITVDEKTNTNLKTILHSANYSFENQKDKNLALDSIEFVYDQILNKKEIKDKMNQTFSADNPKEVVVSVKIVAPIFRKKIIKKSN
jgi:HKD family nuclease